MRLLNLTEPSYLSVWSLLYYTLPNAVPPKFRYVLLQERPFVVAVLYASEYLLEICDRYVSHFLDARLFWFGRPCSGLYVLVHLGGKNHDYWLYFKRQRTTLPEKLLQTRSGEIL